MTPLFTLLAVNGQPVVPVFLESGEITVSGNAEELQGVKATGTVSNDAYAAYVEAQSALAATLENPEATEEILKGDWLLTGDMAKEDEDGFIYLVDRKKDVIITGGENLYPVQIEDYLRKNDKIKDVAVIGLPDARLGEIAAAIIEIKEGETCTQAEIDEFCKAMPRYKRPKKIFFDKVPRNPTGKIEKPVLREKYCGKRLVEAQITG